jgi:hypothetical protein
MAGIFQKKPENYEAFIGRQKEMCRTFKKLFMSQFFCILPAKNCSKTAEKENG